MIDALASTDAQTRSRAFAPQRHAGAIVTATAALLTAMAVLFIDVGSAVRACVSGEGLWSKAQKQAVLALLAYAGNGDEARWQAYEAAIAIPLSARRALVGLTGPTYDEPAVRAGFEGTGVHPDDVDGIVRLFRWGGSLPAVDEAMRAWAEADRLISALDAQAQAVRRAVRDGASAPQRDALRMQVLRVDAEIAPVARHFSEVLEATDRQLRSVFSWTMLAGAGTLSLVVWLWLARGQRLADQQQRALRDSEARRSRVLRGSCDGYFEWRLDRKDVHVSPRFAELLGYRAGGLDGSLASLRSLLHPGDRPAVRAAWRRHRDGGAPIDLDLRLRRHDGGWQWFGVRASILRAADGDGRWLSGSISDITRRRDAEDALRRREALFRSLWETMLDGVLIVGADERIRYANPALRSILGHDPQALLGQPLSMLQGPDAAQAQHRCMRRHLATGERHFDWRAMATEALHRDGHRVPLEISLGELELEGERLFVGVLRDVTARRAAERALQEAHDRLETRVAERTRELRAANERLHELDRLKSDFVATMNHELRTPLNAVLGFTSLLLEGHSGPLNDAQREQLGHVGRAGQHLLALINDVLDLSRLDAGRLNLAPQDFDLSALVREVAAQLQPAATAKGLKLAQDLPPMLRLRADRRRVMQVLLNLAGNALKFTTSGEVRLFACEQTDGVTFGVEDTGVGIPEDRLSELFEPFRQLENASSGTVEGTGLGLYLSRRLVEAMGGRVEVRSAAGVGSCFTVHLPDAPGDPADV